MPRADIIVVGGGIVGCATAFELARRGGGTVVLLEKEPLLGTGATSKCAGGIRAQFSSEVNSRISALSEQIFINFKAEVGVDARYEQVGYLFCLSTPDHEAAFRRQFTMWEGLGLPVVWFSPEQIAAKIPMLETGDLIGGTFCRSDGLADSGEYMTAYEKVARQNGVQIQTSREVIGIRQAGGRVIAVETGDGVIETGRIVNCAGPYASRIGKMAGLDIPVVPLKRQICKTAPLDWMIPDLPMIVDIASGLYMHRESGGMLMGWANPAIQPGYDISTDPEYTDEIIMRALTRMPRLAEAEIATAWSGLYETTPDHHAIMGPVDGLEGYWVCAGFSGHGFMHAPAAGRLMAEWMVDGAPSIDLTLLAPGRFARGAALKESNVI